MHVVIDDNRHDPRREGTNPEAAANNKQFDDSQMIEVIAPHVVAMQEDVEMKARMPEE